MKINDAGLDLIKRYEGLRLSAYRDPGGVPTIGYGHTRSVVMGTTITQAQAENLLRDDVSTAEGDVERAVKVAMNSNEFSALVSLAYNIGGTAFANSTLVKRLNAGDKAAAAEQFSVWRMDNGKVLPGLVTRRAAERALFLTPIGAVTPPLPERKPDLPIVPPPDPFWVRVLSFLLSVIRRFRGK